MPGAKKFTLLGLMVGASAKKFAQRAENTPNSTFLYSLGEFFRGSAGGGAVPGEFFRANRYRVRSCRRRAPSLPAVVGVLHYMKPSGRVSPACRTLMSCNSPAQA